MSYTFTSLSSSKPIYTAVYQETGREFFAKGGMSNNEIELQKVASSLGIAPKIHGFEKHNNMNLVLMDLVKGMSIADFYGEDSKKIPPYVWSEIHRILKLLWCNGIEYIDITPYNFIIDPESGEICIIDFGHARYVKMNPVLQNILKGDYAWNQEFA